jgi:DNA-directed RNA polymerase subunit N (RpoN/RPB10)
MVEEKGPEHILISFKDKGRYVKKQLLRNLLLSLGVEKICCQLMLVVINILTLLLYCTDFP